MTAANSYVPETARSPIPARIISRYPRFHDPGLPANNGQLDPVQWIHSVLDVKDGANRDGANLFIAGVGECNELSTNLALNRRVRRSETGCIVLPENGRVSLCGTCETLELRTVVSRHDCR